MEWSSSIDTDADDSYSIVERIAGAMRVEDESAKLTDHDDIVRQLWEGPRKCQCCINWIDEMPKGVEIKHVEDIDDSHPLILRHRILPGEGKDQVSIHSIEVRDANARGILIDVFRGLDNIVPDIKYLIFLAPFRQFFWRWDRFEKAIQDQTDVKLKSTLNHLRAVVRRELAEAFAVTSELVSHGVITYKYIWTLFPPGELVYQAHYDRFFIVDGCDVNTKDDLCEINSWFVDWDGLKFGSANWSHLIMAFGGTQKITRLQTYPAKYIKNLDSVRHACIERGRKFRSLAGVRYKSYRVPNMPAFSAETTEGRVSSVSRSKHDRRIILDARGHFSNRPTGRLADPEDPGRYTTGLIVQAPLDATPPGGHRPLQRVMLPNDHFTYDFEHNEAPPTPLAAQTPFRAYNYPTPPPVVVSERRRHRVRHAPVLDPLIRPRRRDSFHSSTSYEPLDHNSDEYEQYLTDLQLLLCNSEMLGYCMKDKQWQRFHVNNIYDIDWNDEPFESLVLPDGYKDLIVSFVDHQLRDGDAFDDVINGKGGGLVLLLAGDPGVGKTLTAESVAEKMHAPLYKMELGQLEDDYHYQSPGQGAVEERITTAFNLASKWKAVLLIDECDLYLEKRSDASPARNRIVTRFLQELEYYPSLLFLTTNREKVLDPAIYSRIHLTINYPALDVPSRRQIWSTFLSRESFSISGTELDILANVKMNGRRIRNIVKTVGIMKLQRQQAICFNDIKAVIRITEGICIEDHE